MESFILIVLMQGYGRVPAGFSQEFVGKRACIIARDRALNGTLKGIQVVAYCTPKQIL